MVSLARSVPPDPAASRSGPVDPRDLELSAYDYPLAPDRIAQRPAAVREHARLMVLPRAGGTALHRRFDALPERLAPGDLLVVNDVRVRRARLVGRRASGGRVEALLLAEVAPGRYEALVKPSRRLKEGEALRFEGQLTLTVVGRSGRRMLLEGPADGWSAIEAVGRPPLPPYIGRGDADAGDEDLERYQTVFARAPGAVAAPTAGLHFSAALLAAVEAAGVHVARVTLDVGPGTFLPVQTEQITAHPMHEEAYAFPAACATAINQRTGRLFAVGTTSCRVLETVARAQRPPYVAASGATRLFLHPGNPPQLVDGLITNFHLPRSTLLMLVAAFVGRERLLAAYTEAAEAGYRFYSYGDAMLIAP